MPDDFCPEHGYEFMKQQFGNPIPYCERCEEEREAMKIETHYDQKPIPTRECDWQATFDNFEPGCPVGHGETESDAMDDLLQQVDPSDPAYAQTIGQFQRTLLAEILQRCNDNGGEIDGAMVGKIKRAIGSE